ncbi:hypothetical protein MMC11_002239 [Xylographa trunciseda]|nr:hypothetical protein [Xylographa trunciseda]
MDASYTRHSRRSHPNLHHLSITPLTPAYPLPLTTDPPSPTSHHRASYLLPPSLPQTPSLLSRSPSRTRPHRGSKSSHALSDLSFALTRPTPTKASTARPRTRGSTASLDGDGASWLLQTAARLTSTAAEAKGQAWLATRTSSTSLVDDSPSAYPEPGDAAYRADDEFSPVSTRYSRPGSRHASARGSRRASGVGEGLLVGGVQEGEGREREGREEYFGGGVDFVEEGEEDVWEDEDGEMRRVVWGRVGGWVDWAVGWMDWRVDGEEGEEREEGMNGEVGQEEVEKVDGRRRRRRRGEGDRIVMLRRENVEKLEVPPPEGDGGWKDAAWLLGVAKKVLI